MKKGGHFGHSDVASKGGQRKIARKLGVGRNTVKKYLENKELPGEHRRTRKRKSLLDPYKDNIKACLEEYAPPGARSGMKSSQTP